MYFYIYIRNASVYFMTFKKICVQNKMYVLITNIFELRLTDARGSCISICAAKKIYLDDNNFCSPINTPRVRCIYIYISEEDIFVDYYLRIELRCLESVLCPVGFCV